MIGQTPTLGTACLSDLHPDNENARKHPERNIDAIRASVSEFGVVCPLVVNKRDSMVIGGNARLQVLLELGHTEAPVVWVDLDRPQAKALGLALNRSAELADWDYQAVADALEEVKQSDISIESTGWLDTEYEALTANLDGLIDAMADGFNTEKKDKDTDKLAISLMVASGVKRADVLACVSEAISDRWSDDEVTIA